MRFKEIIDYFSSDTIEIVDGYITVGRYGHKKKVTLMNRYDDNGWTYRNGKSVKLDSDMLRKQINEFRAANWSEQYCK